jgi:uncharacterized protein (DUF488 family)
LHKNTRKTPLFQNSQVKNIENKLFEDYKKNLSSKQKHIEGLLQVLQEDKLIAITCFEADYKCCHRHVLADFICKNHTLIHL